jgi:hypothetical protein
MSLDHPSKAFQQLSALRAAMLNTLASVWMNRGAWSKEYREKTLNDLMVKALSQDDQQPSFYPGGVDLGQLDEDELKALGFKLWSETFPGLRLIPLWALPALPPSGAVYSIRGERVDYSPENPLDDDDRFGFLAYGVMPLGAPLVRVEPSELAGCDEA